MESVLHTVGYALALIIEAIALFLIAIGTVEALIYFLDREVENTRRLQYERGTERAA